MSESEQMATQRILADLKYLDRWKAEMIKIILENKSMHGVSRKLRPMLIISKDE
jgi:hypothetical protein